MGYQNKRGGRVVFQDIAKPSTMEWGTPLEAMEAVLELEKTVNQSLLDLHKAADGDAHLCDFLEANFLGEQVEAIKEISGWISKLKRVGRTPTFAMNLTRSSMERLGLQDPAHLTRSLNQ